jgi:hypothetical protein
MAQRPFPERRAEKIGDQKHRGEHADRAGAVVGARLRLGE